MTESIEHPDLYYILSDTSLAAENNKVLKHGDMFAIYGNQGNMGRFGFEDQGLYYEGTRFLSKLVFRMGQRYPVFLSSIVKEDNDAVTFDFTNCNLNPGRGNMLKRGDVHLERSVFLYERTLYEKIEIANYSLEPAEFSVEIEFDADFVDIFEVRGMERQGRGLLLEPIEVAGGVVLSYTGLDSITRKSSVLFDPGPDWINGRKVGFNVSLEPHQSSLLCMRVACDTKLGSPVFDYESAHAMMRSQVRKFRDGQCVIETSNEQFNDWLGRSASDLFMMLSATEHGLYPYAGIPWFSTVFGRDGLITAMETLWLYPDIARGVLLYLASQQSQRLDIAQDAEPGKILHEQRKGEMVNLGEIPFGQYFGSIDSTLLFLMLGGYYYRRSGDRELIERLWPNFERALQWIDGYGDQDGDGFVEYSKKSPNGLLQQGWKDSDDSVFHDDGSIAEPPIALCEVQGYAYEAKLQMAWIAKELGNEKAAEQLSRQAQQLKVKFHDKFWCDKIGGYALALDGNKQPCCVRSSNAGHCLFTGIASEQAAVKITHSLMDEASFSGWGIRTIATGQLRYNPMSYHNGCIWPHDNALIAYGMSRYGLKQAAVRVLSGLFDAAIFIESYRLPELFCGFARRHGEGPIPYPVACKPQAWASAAVFLLLQACLGISIDHAASTLYFDNPVLPACLERLRIRNLPIAGGSVDVNLHRYPSDVTVNVSRRSADVEVMVRK